jgi:hypothetical protein
MTTTKTEIMNAFGPLYPALPQAAKFRRLANGRELTREETKAYGATVLQGIRNLQRLELIGRGSSLTHKPPTLVEALTGSYPRATAPTTHKVENGSLAPCSPDQKALWKRSQHNPDNWDAGQRRRYEQAMEETRAAREAQAAKQAAVTEAPTAEVIALPVKPARLALVNADGTFNRSNIMREAHAMAKAMQAENPALNYRGHFSIALKAAWGQARNPIELKAAA